MLSFGIFFQTSHLQSYDMIFDEMSNIAKDPKGPSFCFLNIFEI